MTERTRPIRIPPQVPLVRFHPSTATARRQGEWHIQFRLPETVPAGAPLGLLIHGRRHVKGEFLDLDVSVSGPNGELLQTGPMTEGAVPIAFEKTLSEGEYVRVCLRGVPPKHAQADRFITLFLPEEPDQSVPATNRNPGRRILSAAVVDVVGGETEHLRVYAPSGVNAGEPFSILVRPEDAFDNVSSEAPGRLQIHREGVPVQYEGVRPAWGNCVWLDSLILPRADVWRLEVRDLSASVSGLSNPIVVRDPDAAEMPEPEAMANAYWGMIHGHTELSDGAGTIEHYFSYMRDACALDFAAAGDHDHLWETSDAMFQMMRDAVTRHHDDGRFVTFPGYEWAKWRQNGDGDRCVDFPHPDQAEFVRSDDGHADAPQKLFEEFRDRDVLVIPHHTAEGGNFCDFKDHDPRVERHIEIYSVWGNSERPAADGNPYPVPHETPGGFVQDALALGWRVGFTAGGDDHMGHSGDEAVLGKQGHKAGLLGVWAEARTRDSIWRALKARRCWGTTGPRILVRFQVNGACMGSQCRASENPDLTRARRIVAEVSGTAPIAKAEVVRNNQTIHIASGGENLAFEFEDTDPLSDVLLPATRFSPRPFAFYYLRVTQRDGEMAWASPVWVE